MSLWDYNAYTLFCFQRFLFPNWNMSFSHVKIPVRTRIGEKQRGIWYIFLRVRFEIPCVNKKDISRSLSNICSRIFLHCSRATCKFLCSRVCIRRARSSVILIISKFIILLSESARSEGFELLLWKRGSLN